MSFIDKIDNWLEKPRAWYWVYRYTQAIDEGNIYVNIQTPDFAFLDRNENAYLERGRNKLTLGDYRGAEQDYLHALETARDTNEKYYAYYALGELYCKLAFDKGDSVNYRNALKHYNSAVSTRYVGSLGAGLIRNSIGLISLGEVKEEPQIYVLRGLVKCKLKDYAGAIEDFTKAISLDSKNASIRKYGLIGDPKDTVVNLLEETKKNSSSSMDDKDLEALISKNFDFSLKLKRIQHYQFAFQTLPTLIFEQGEQLLNKWSVKEEADKSLKQTWEEVGNALPDKLSSDGLSIERTTKDGWTIFTVNLPKPEMQPEAYCCFILFRPSNRTLKYYTVEKGLGRDILGEITNTGTHGNHGGLDDLNRQSILEKILMQNQ